MSLAEAKRFADALASDSKLLAAVKPKVNGLAAFVEAGKQHGYDFSIDDAKQLIRAQVPAHRLSDEQLDAIGGGAGSSGPTGQALAVATVAGVAPGVYDVVAFANIVSSGGGIIAN